jgi:hypothetical protein
MSEDKVDEQELAKTKEGLEKAELTAKENLRTILKCKGCGTTMDIPADLRAKMDADEDISGSLPSCSCGGEMAISVTTL